MAAISGSATTLAIGGVPMGRQVRALMNGVDVLVATPGRLLDLVHSNALRLNQVEVLVLDEADRMLDMGFIHDIRKIVAKLPSERQTLFFSATMPQQIAELAKQMLRDPVKVAVTPAATTVEKVAQRVIHVDRAGKAALLADLLRTETIDRALVFTRTKHGADKVVRGLVKSGIAAQAIHGNKSQSQRERVLADFRAGKIRILVATDIAARGIDVDGISHVINYDLPNEPETYVHRIGRTARAGATGIAISLLRPRGGPLPARHREADPPHHRGAGQSPLARSRRATAQNTRAAWTIVRMAIMRSISMGPRDGRTPAGAARVSPTATIAARSARPNARNGAPVYGERPSAPARQPHGHGDAAQHRRVSRAALSRAAVRTA